MARNLKITENVKYTLQDVNYGAVYQNFPELFTKFYLTTVYEDFPTVVYQNFCKLFTKISPTIVYEDFPTVAYQNFPTSVYQGLLTSVY